MFVQNIMLRGSRYLYSTPLPDRKDKSPSMLCLKTMAKVLGFCDVTIAAVGMDHCQAARNAAKYAGAESVVDCFIHVDRCMVKNRGKLNRPDYISTAREHIRIRIAF
jgi:hypothetical protein